MGIAIVWCAVPVTTGVYIGLRRGAWQGWLAGLALAALLSWFADPFLEVLTAAGCWRGDDNSGCMTRVDEAG